MVTEKEITEKISELEIEYSTLKSKHAELHSVDDSEEWEKSYYKIFQVQTQIKSLKWAMGMHCIL